MLATRAVLYACMDRVGEYGTIPNPCPQGSLLYIQFCPAHLRHFAFLVESFCFATSFRAWDGLIWILLWLDSGVNGNFFFIFIFSSNKAFSGGYSWACAVWLFVYCACHVVYI